MEIYCVKCKSKTSTLNLIESVTKNNKPLLRGTCEICGSKKCKFTKSKVGGVICDSGNHGKKWLYLPNEMQVEFK